MLYLFTGTSGSYKSYHATEEALSKLKQGYNVIANFPIDYKRLGIKPRGEFVFIKNSDVSVQYFLNYARKTHRTNYKTQTVVYLDEASTMFNSRLFNDKGRIEWINFFANHRHFNFDFVLITQMDMMLDKQIRGLVETEIRHRALKNYKLMGFLINLLFHGCYMAVECWYPCKLRVGSSFHVFRQKIANCYDTMLLFIDDKSDKGADQLENSDDKKDTDVKKIDKSQKQDVLSKIKHRFNTTSDVHDSSDTVDSVDVVDSCNTTSDGSSSS